MSRRSDETLYSKRSALDWPSKKPFRILSIDGGGILGLLPTLILKEVEDRYLDGSPIGKYFDLITGTSTGGIIALGLGQGRSAESLSNLYLERGEYIFPPGNSVTRFFRKLRHSAFYIYDRSNLENELRREFQNERFGSSTIPLCIPAFEGHFGEPYIFKTPHHPDYKQDQHETLVDVGLSTSAAPTYFPSQQRNGYTFVDGGIWANNPVMVGLVDALTCFNIEREQVSIISLGCGQKTFSMGSRLRIGGRLPWAKGFYQASMRSQSHNALGQAGLLIGRDRLLRLDIPESNQPLEMDDVKGAIEQLPNMARTLVDACGSQIIEIINSSNMS